MVNIVNWNDEISKCIYDDSVGIIIAKLAGGKSFCTFIKKYTTQINQYWLKTFIFNV